MALFENAACQDKLVKVAEFFGVGLCTEGSRTFVYPLISM